MMVALAIITTWSFLPLTGTEPKPQHSIPQGNSETLLKNSIVFQAIFFYPSTLLAKVNLFENEEPSVFLV